MTDDREYQPEVGDADSAKTARHQYAREKARRVVEEFRLTEPPVDIEVLVAARGLRLVKKPVPGGVSGQLYPHQREIFVNTNSRSVERQRFTMAHEFGHWELQHHLEDEELPADSQGFEGVYQSGGGLEGRSSIEIEANTFAAELLIPGRWIRKEKRPLAGGRATELAELYQVSREAMFYQLMLCKMF